MHEAVLAAIPGISTVTARALLQTFGTVARIVAASEQELSAVDGVGPRRAAALREAFLGASSPQAKKVRT